MQYICEFCRGEVHVLLLTSDPPQTLFECQKCGASKKQAEHNNWATKILITGLEKKKK